MKKVVVSIITALAVVLVLGCSSPSGGDTTPPGPATISLLAIPGVTAPVLGATPVTSLDASQYTGTVSWSPAVSGTFAASTEYTATITLTAKTGYTLTGVAVNSFTVAGASATNPVNTGVVTAEFIVTVALISDTIGNIMAVTGGTFNNGAANMTVSSFRMSQYEITGERYATVMEVADPSNFDSISNNPVEMVNWYEAVEFCNKLSTRERLTPVYTITDRTPATGYPITLATVSVSDWSASGYRLPTEAEWQFAARGGNNTNNYTYAGSNTIGDVAWCGVSAGSTTHTVGTKATNELGLHDMTGNVLEWCWDWGDVYPTTAQTDYRGAASGTYRVFRGGSWNYFETFCTVADRYGDSPNYRSNGLGFRVVRL